MDLPMYTVNKLKNDVDPIDNDHTPNLEVEKLCNIQDSIMDDKGKGNVEEPILKTIPRPRQPYAQRLKQKQEERKFGKFFSIFMELFLNIMLVKALEQMPGFAKLLKDLFSRKKTVIYEPSNNVH